MIAAPAAATSITVDLSTTIRPATHAANGSLYGVLETRPDVTTLIAPLHPNMFNNPAAVGSGKQQPVGDAIVVAGRVAPTGATVTIRLADWFPGWYTFTTMTDWLSKIDQTVARRKAANLTNIYAYELWNEPNGTWGGDPNSTSGSTKPLAFNEFWAQTYAHVRAAEPDIKITGPSLAGYQSSYMSSFLTYCKANNCLPDIIGWHDGSGIGGNVTSYRNLEKSLGISPLPITINEYSGPGDITDEGKPGASAPIIAAMERQGVQTACITYWDVPNPGRLGSLLATDTQTNGGWFFYKWYGEMAGSMVATTPPVADGQSVDAFASLDPATATASVLTGGKNDGSIQIVVKGFASYFGSTVHATVEHTPWVNKSTVVTATDTVSSADVPITNGQITISIANTNATDGWHVIITPVGGPIDAGAGDASSSSGAGTPDAGSSGGASSSSGGRSSSSSGASTSSSSSGSSASSSSGASTSSSGGKGTSSSGASTASSSGGATGSSSGSATTSSSGGMATSSSGSPTSSGGTASSGSAPSNSSSGGSSGSGSGGSAAENSTPSGSSSSSGCSTAPGRSRGVDAAAFIAFAAFAVRRRRSSKHGAPSSEG
jgi:hypothetical protein